ncbi:hypothetical protein FDP41_009469 [Naegleria fowleri]|uniref:DUF4246 domain-containing protein n=1 Tax=Naegleria fowleri TaxID=5763 RepID=A0A6A5BDU9_NAEFO|nr:uncharacterized protein FDP41_009469 [Naegleria fowleri]KAF0972265.1 hypothetical protein FDP41_009469 [Naegleria fowleri]
MSTSDADEFIQACKSGDLPLARKLFRPFTIDDECSKGGGNALYWACLEGHFEIVKFLIDEGADVNFENIFNENNDTTQRVETALHAAVEANHPNIVSLLWELEDIDPDIENHNEETALDLAKKLNYHECEEILSKTSETKKRKISHDSDDDDKDSKSSNSPIELPSRSDFKKFQISSMDVEWIVEQVKNKKDWIHKYLLLCEKWKQECLSDTMRISEASVEVAFKILEDLRNDFFGTYYHPGSNNQVLDLIHPSLYCYHYAHSVLKEDSPFILESNPDILWIPTWFKKQRTQNTTHFVQQNSQHESDSIKDQAEKQNQHSAEIDFDITYESYINNICEVKQKNLANVICKVMCYFVPMWEQHYSIHYSPCDVTFDRFQVIVKAATIVVHPDKPYYPGGTWHTEGLDENIVATGIYYYHSENVKESFLDFRQNLTDRELRDYGAPEGTLSFELLGSVETKQDRCIAFPNIFQHRVKHFFPLDPTRPAIRKILVFFLINPKKPIISTNDIDVQRLDFLLNRCMVLCKILPLEIIYRHILDFFASHDVGRSS